MRKTRRGPPWIGPSAIAAMMVATAVGRGARGETPRDDDDAWRVRSSAPLLVDGGLVFGAPASLPTGLSAGIGGGASYGRLFAIGFRAAWSTATESSLAWTVTQSDFKLRATAAFQGTVGRGLLALRLGLGPTVVHESRLRNQGARAGLSGTDLGTTAWAPMPAADLDAIVALHIAGRWLLTMSAGPTVTESDGHGRFGWSAQIGTGWQP